VRHFTRKRAVQPSPEKGRRLGVAISKTTAGHASDKQPLAVLESGLVTSSVQPDVKG